MTNTKHTPGPWHIGHQDTQSVRADGLLVSTLACQRKEWQANARLIAAAPELLKALESIGTSLPQVIPSPVFAEFVKVWGNLAVPAIKKAKGEA